MGFVPIEWQWNDRRDPTKGIHFSKQELLEFSIVSVPANREALIELSAADRAKAQRQRELDLVRLRG